MSKTYKVLLKTAAIIAVLALTGSQVMAASTAVGGTTTTEDTTTGPATGPATADTTTTTGTGTTTTDTTTTTGDATDAHPVLPRNKSPKAAIKPYMRKH